MAYFEVIPENQRSIFSYSGIEQTTDKNPPSSLISNRYVVMSRNNGKKILSRMNGSIDNVIKASTSLFDATGQSVIVGRFFALENNKPLYKTVAKVTKKADPLSDREFKKLLNSFASRLGRISDKESSRMSEQTIRILERNWSKISSGDWGSVEEELSEIYSDPRVGILREQQQEIEQSSHGFLLAIVAATMLLGGVRDRVPSSYRFPFRGTSVALARHHRHFATGQYNRMSAPMARRVRETVQRGIRENLSRERIQRQAEKDVRRRMAMRNYQRVVASNALSRSRSYAMARTLQAAGHRYYKWTSVLDERTTPQCVFMHNKLIPIGPSIAMAERSLREPDPEQAYEHTPFIDFDGEEISVTPRNGRRTVLARMNRRRVPVGVSRTDIVDSGVALPPAHWLCRSTVSTVTR